MKQSLAYANDRSVYNALNQNKITGRTIQELFIRKGIICSSDTDREELATYFSRLTHDFIDHKLIADSIGIIPRREKITYTEIDYSKSDFQQMTTRHGKITINIEDNTAHIRSTQTKFINKIKEDLVSSIISLDEENLKRNVITLNDINDPNLRTKFILETIKNIQEYELEEITQVGIFKNNSLLEETESEDEREKIIANINDAHLKGNDVHLTSELRHLSDKGFYYVKVIATLKSIKTNLLYTVDIEFKDKENCDLFSYIVKHISEPKYDTATQTLSSYKFPRAPKMLEQIDFMDKLEESAKNALESL